MSDEMSDDKPVMEFPCTFPIKAMGLAQHDLESIVHEIVQRHVPELTRAQLQRRDSSAGKYLSITVTITATSREQLDAIYYDLTACEQVVMAL